MSVVLVGDAPVGPILVTDAFVLHDNPENIKSFHDASLQFKITLLGAFDGCCSLVGDQTLEYAIHALDNWAIFKGKKINFLNQRTIEQGIIPVAEKLIQQFKAKSGELQPYTDGADIYFIGPDGAWEIQIRRNQDRYRLHSLNHLPKNEALINYAGHKTKIIIRGNEENYLNNAASIIEDHHLFQKTRNEFPLPYDLDSRFCGVFYPWGSLENKKILHPFRDFSEYLVFATGNQKPWELNTAEWQQWELPDSLLIN